MDRGATVTPRRVNAVKTTSMPRRIVLDNGVRVVTEFMPSVRSAAVGIWVDVGSRDEGLGEEGLSHFLEHMFFKGTRRRSAQDLAMEIDVLGGELNAFTSRETTTFYTKALDEHLPRAVALLGEIFLDSTFAASELEREKQVVLEEIKMIEDDPEEFLYDLHTDYVWRQHPLGRPILGELKTIETMTRRRLTGFLAAHYHPARTVIAVSGRFDRPRIDALIAKTFGRFTGAAGPTAPRTAPKTRGGVWLKRKALEQVHICLGADGLSQVHEDRYALHVLNAILGGSVSSRLFQEVRERRGLAYSIYSGITAYHDAGLFSVYAATGKPAAQQVIALCLRECKKLRSRMVPKDELARAKDHLKGSLALGLEGTSSRMSRLAKDELYGRRHVSLAEMTKGIDAVTPDDVRRVAKVCLAPETMALTVLGPMLRRDLPSSF
jgi:predicted Zn-dependent peptidase